MISLEELVDHLRCGVPPILRQGLEYGQAGCGCPQTCASQLVSQRISQATIILYQS